MATMNEMFRAEIESQPSVLQQTLPELRAQARVLSQLTDVRRVVFAGSGDSYFAPLALQAAVQSILMRPVDVLPSMRAARYWRFSAGDLLVAISISGETHYTVAAAKSAREAGARVLAITADDKSSLARVGAFRLILPVRSRSRQTPHAVDYVSSLLAIAIVSEQLVCTSLPILDRLSMVTQRTLETLEGSCRELGKRYAGSPHFFFLGSGPNGATARYGAAKLWEAGGIPALGLDLEEFAHGAHLMLRPGQLILLIAPKGPGVERARSMIAGLRGVGAHPVLITDEETGMDVQRLTVPSLTEDWSPFLTCLPLQWLCLFVANARGYDVLEKNGLGAEPSVYRAIQRA